MVTTRSRTRTPKIGVASFKGGNLPLDFVQNMAINKAIKKYYERNPKTRALQ
jgi:hypothetical protein